MNLEVIPLVNHIPWPVKIVFAKDSISFKVPQAARLIKPLSNNSGLIEEGFYRHAAGSYLKD